MTSGNNSFSDSESDGIDEDNDLETETTTSTASWEELSTPSSPMGAQTAQGPQASASQTAQGAADVASSGLLDAPPAPASASDEVQEGEGSSETAPVTSPVLSEAGAHEAVAPASIATTTPAR